MENKSKPGERAFSFVLLIIGSIFLVESIKMYIDEPTASSYGALPLFLSILIVILLLKIIIFEDREKTNEDQNINFRKKTKIALQFVFTKDIIVTSLFMIGYCIALYVGLGFKISTSLFLFITISYLMKDKQHLKNFLYTVICMAFVLLVFETVFSVILP